jgi:hypothetical protein
MGSLREVGILKFEFVMAGLVPAIHVLVSKEVVDARIKSGHDEQ